MTQDLMTDIIILAGGSLLAKDRTTTLWNSRLHSIKYGVHKDGAKPRLEPRDFEQELSMTRKAKLDCCCNVGRFIVVVNVQLTIV